MTNEVQKAASEASRAKAIRSHERVKAAEKKAKRLTKAQQIELHKRAARMDSNISHHVTWFTDEADAEMLAALQNLSRVKNPCMYTYNGGYMHGAPCGREEYRDLTMPDGSKLFAVSG